MSLDMRPILSALLRNRTGAVLVALQIAIALAVLVNAVFIVKQRIDQIGRPTGMDVENIFAIASNGFTERFNYRAALDEDLAYLRGLDGVVAATAANHVPLSGSGSSTDLLNRPDDLSSGVNGNYFEMDEQGLATLGVRLTAGRPFTREDILPPRRDTMSSEPFQQVLLTRSYAEELFPDRNPLGAAVYDVLGRPITVTGIIEQMHGSWPWSDRVDKVFIAPRQPAGPDTFYLVRTKPGMRDAVMRQVEAHIMDSNPERVIEWIRPLTLFKQRVYLDDYNTAIFLASVTALMLAIAALGIFGLATFNVSTRTKQIGTRRAVGARRRDIVRYFLVENWLITTAGVVFGCALALATGYWLSLQYQLPRLDLYFLVGGVLALWAVGLLAVLPPARRAATVSPAVATRTV